MTRTTTLLATCLFLSFGLVACDGGGGDTDAGPTGTDAGPTTGMDSGPTRRDAGPTDPCAGDDATATVGCNGAILGASRPADGFGGTCTPGTETDPSGSCSDPDSLCYNFGAEPDFNETAVGTCVVPCVSNGTTYVNTGDCPTGSRCFEIDDGVSFCFPDCNAGTDCASGTCDGDLSCVGDDSMPLPDGGVTGDGGAPAVDAGVTTDGGAAVDAGVAVDAG